jgi:hypothetical protein
MQSASGQSGVTHRFGRDQQRGRTFIYEHFRFKLLFVDGKFGTAKYRSFDSIQSSKVLALSI